MANTERHRPCSERAARVHSVAVSTEFDWTAVGDEAVDHLKALLRLDTRNPPGNEIVAAEYLAKVFDAEGIEYQLIESAPTRANIVARLKGNGSKQPLLLNGHLDVVAVDEAKWTHPPFEALEADGCIWGRGAIDMKNMVTMSLMTMLLLKRHGVSLDRDVIFAGVADEEAGSHAGSLFLVEQHPELVRAEYVLNEVGGHTLHIGDTRFCPIQVSEKGICWFELSAEGEPGHGSMPHPKNPVVRLAKAIERLGRTRLPQHNTKVVEGFLDALSGAAPGLQKYLLGLLLQPKLSAPILDQFEKINIDQAIGINAMLRNTANPTVLAGGNKVNVIPSRASVQVDGRLIPGQSKEAFLREVRGVVGDDLGIDIIDHHDGTVFDRNTPLWDAICKVVERRDPGAVPVPYMIPGFTDSFAYGRLGATCYGFSPVKLPPDINFTRMYHGHDERIPVEGFKWGQRVLYEVVRDFCGA